MFSVQTAIGHYQRATFNGRAGKNGFFPGMQPFRASLEYLGEQTGFRIYAQKIAFNMPDFGGAKTIGYMEELEYNNKLDGFKGKGTLEAATRVRSLGRMKSKVTMNRNRLNNMQVVFLGSAFPATNPIITGSAHGEVDFDDFNRFKKAEIQGDWNLLLRDDDGKTKPTPLTGKAFYNEGKYGAELELHEDLEINEYIKATAFRVEVGPDGVVVTKGSFDIVGIDSAH